jgi:hypothetical protein
VDGEWLSLIDSLQHSVVVRSALMGTTCMPVMPQEMGQLLAEQACQARHEDPESARPD